MITLLFFVLASVNLSVSRLEIFHRGTVLAALVNFLANSLEVDVSRRLFSSSVNSLSCLHCEFEI